MALGRLKNWIAEVLTYSDLNAEFNNILANPIALISPLAGNLDIDGKTITVDAAGATTFVSSASKSWDFTSGAKAGTPATTGSVANWAAQTFTDSATAGSGTAASYVAYAIQRPTLAATNTLVTTTNAATFYIPNAPLAGTNETITNPYALWVDAGNVRLDGDASVAGALNATGTLTATGALVGDATTDSTSITTGAFQTDGGLGVAKALWVGGLANIAGAVTLQSTLNVTGIPTIPTAAVDTNTTQAASTAFVLAQSATQAQQETATSTINFVSPGRQHFHPSAIQARAKWTSAATPVVTAAYNVSGVVKNSTGNYTASFTTPFSTANYAYSFGHEDTGNSLTACVAAQLSGSINVIFRDAAGNPVDANGMTLMCSGDL